MYCTNCGNVLGEADKYCPQCGRANGPGPGPSGSSGPGVRTPLVRPLFDRKLAGVCAGLARYYNFDATWARVAFVLAIFLHGLGLLAYIIGWIAIPNEQPSAYTAGTR